MIKTSKQIFIDAKTCEWKPFGDMCGVSFVPLAEPVPKESIHRARLAQGTVIPPHTHPADKYVLVVSGTVENGGRRCEAGTFWITPTDTKPGPHVAITDAEILTIRLGALGKLEL